MRTSLVRLSECLLTWASSALGSRQSFQLDGKARPLLASGVFASLGMQKNLGELLLHHGSELALRAEIHMNSGSKILIKIGNVWDSKCRCETFSYVLVSTSERSQMLLYQHNPLEEATKYVLLNLLHEDNPFHFESTDGGSWHSRKFHSWASFFGNSEVETHLTLVVTLLRVKSKSVVNLLQSQPIH